VTTLVVLDGQTGQPAGIITDTDVAHVVADGKDVNNGCWSAGASWPSG
jgi:CBS domain-containing protein